MLGSSSVARRKRGSGYRSLLRRRVTSAAATLPPAMVTRSCPTRASSPRALRWVPAGRPCPIRSPAPYPAVVSMKSAGIAVLLSFVWPGLGHLYVGKIGAGIALICTELVMILSSFLIITLIVTVPVGVVTLVAAAATAASAAQDYRPPGFRGS